MRVGLAYRKQGDIPDALKKVDVPSGARLYIPDVADERPDPRVIGENREQGVDPTRIESAGGTPTRYVGDALRVELGHAGFTLVQSPRDATLVLITRLTTFFVSEKEDYRAEVAARVELRDAAGKVLFEGRVIGSKSQWGRSLTAENYREVLAKATVDFVGNLVTHPGFKRGLTAAREERP